MTKSDSGSPGVLGVLAVLFGITAEALTGAAWWRLMTWLGASVLIWRFTPDPQASLKRLFRACGLLYREPDGREKLPRILADKQEGDTREVTVSIPPGRSSEDFKRSEQKLGEALNSTCTARYHDGRITLRFSTAKLEEQYAYAVTPLPGTTIPIGHSTEKLENLEFGDSVSNLLVGGPPGVGKSCFLRVAITNLALTKSPSQLQLYLLDLKSGAEFTMFRNLPHVAGFANNVVDAAKVLRYLLHLTQKRYETLAKSGSVNATEYNKKHPQKLDSHLIIVDEFANLRREKAAQEDFDQLLRIGRAANVFCVLCTQRPSAETVPGLLKANCQATVAFGTKDALNSRILLDNDLAAKLDDVPGRAIFQRGRRDIEVQVPFLSDDDAKELIRPFLQPKPPAPKPKRGGKSVANWQRPQTT